MAGKPRQRKYDAAQHRAFFAQLLAELKLHALVLSGDLDGDFLAEVVPGIRGARQYGAVLLPLQQLEQGKMSDADFSAAQALFAEQRRDWLSAFGEALKTLEVLLPSILDGIDKQAGQPALRVEKIDAAALLEIVKEPK